MNRYTQNWGRQARTNTSNVIENYIEKVHAKSTPNLRQFHAKSTPPQSAGNSPKIIPALLQGDPRYSENCSGWPCKVTGWPQRCPQVTPDGSKLSPVKNAVLAKGPGWPHKPPRRPGMSSRSLPSKWPCQTTSWRQNSCKLCGNYLLC